MASRRIAKRMAKVKSRQVYRSNIRKPKRQVVKKFANFVGKSTFKAVKSRRNKRSFRRKTRARRRRRVRGRY